MNSGIYTILNKKNGKRYVGSAVDLKKRFRDHRSKLRKEKHHNRHLQNAWNKHGKDAFVFEVLEEWEPEFLVSMEQWWMNMLHPEYNIAPVASSNLGVKRLPPTEEARANMSAGQKGRKCTDETRAKLSAAGMGNTNALGYKQTKETRANMSVAGKGRVFTKEHIANLAEANKGKTKGKPWSPARRAAYEARWSS